MMKSFFGKVQRSKDNESGFTLTEIVITLVIIGILAAIAIPIYAEQQKAAVRTQVDQDMMSSVQAFSSWQNRQDEFNKVPSSTDWTNLIRVRSDSSTTVDIKYPSSSASLPSENRQFCVQASKNIGGESYLVNYNLQTKQKSTGACVFSATSAYNPDENYS